jgi:glycosyltransferase involved in cell wall biosynthesis
MKILYITNGINGSGGLERVLSIKASYLADNFGYQVHILTLNNGDSNPFYEFSPLITYHDIKVRGNLLRYFLSYRKGIKKVLKKVTPNVISVCDDGLKGMLFPILFGNKIPVIYERHASIELNFIKNSKASVLRKGINYMNRKLMIYGANKFDEFVILTKGNQQDWPSVKCTVIPNVLPFKISNENFKKREKTVLAVGTQSYNKGYDRLIEIWSEVYKTHPEWILKIFGKQNPNLKLEQRIRDLGLEKVIILGDPIKNIDNEYKNASIFVMSSRSEGFGMVLIEAMSCGLPCVAFDCPHGPADIIKHEEDGFLIEDGNNIQFSGAIMNLIESNNLRSQMGGLAKENSKRYSPELIIEIWNNLFQNIAST